MPSKHEQTMSTGISNLMRAGGHSLNVARSVDDGQVVHLDLAVLQPSRYQARRITPERVRQLVETIKQQGLLQPVTARPVGENKYELIAGHRRHQAFSVLLAEATSDEERKRWSTIPCVIKLHLTEVQAAALTAVENLERDDGDPLEQGRSLLNVKTAGNFATNQEVANATGLSSPTVSRLIRLAEAPEVIQTAVSPGVFVEVADGKGGTKKAHHRVDLTLALEALRLYRFHEKAAGAKVATDKTARLLERVVRGNWTRARLGSELARLMDSKPGDAASDEGGQATAEGDETTERESTEVLPRTLRQAFRDKGSFFAVYPKNIDTAEAEELRRLQEKLAQFQEQTSRRLAELSKSP